MKERILEIKYIELSQIEEYENNVKEHPEWQISQIADSIQKFGFNDPIAIDENQVIIEGHGRYLAAKKLNLDKIPCIILKDLKDAEKRAYIIAHNKLTMNTGFDIDRLMYELNALKIEGIDLGITGFETAEIEALDTITNESFTSLADEIKNESSIFTISFNFPIEMREKIEEFIRVKTKEYFVNKIIEEMEGE